MPDRVAYDASQVDWTRLNDIAKLIARTLPPPTPEGWVLESRSWRRREYCGTQAEPLTEERTDDYTFGITTEGELFVRVQSNYEFYNPTHTGSDVEPETITILSFDEFYASIFDFDRQLVETRGENPDIRSDLNPGGELLHERKGDGLRARLEAMLGDLAPEESRLIRQQALQRDSAASIQKREAQSTAVDMHAHYDVSQVDWPRIESTAKQAAKRMAPPASGGDHWVLETRRVINRTDAADARAENQTISDQYSYCLRTDGGLFLRHEREVTKYHATTAGSMHTDAPEVADRPLTEADVRLLDFKPGYRREESQDPVRLIKSDYLAGEDLLCDCAGGRLMQLLSDLPARES